MSYKNFIVKVIALTMHHDAWLSWQVGLGWNNDVVGAMFKWKGLSIKKRKKLGMQEEEKKWEESGVWWFWFVVLTCLGLENVDL